MSAHLLRTAARRLWRDSGFTTLVVGMLALGIGSVTSMTAITNQVVLRPLPIEDQDRVAVAWTNNHARDVEHFPYFPPVYDAVRAGASAFLGVAAARENTSDLVIDEAGGTPVTLAASPVLGDFFGVLGVRPVLGRAIGPQDDVASPAELVVDISEGLWVERFGGSPDVLGRSLVTRSGTFTIVGVMPDDFDYPRGADVWMPMRPLYGGAGRLPSLLELDLIVRLAPGVTSAEAAAQLDAAVETDPQLARIYADADPVLRPIAEMIFGELRTAILVLFAGGGLLLGCAALSVANLVLVRAEGRREALAVRRALGATRWHLLREAATEASLLGLAGAAGGAGLAILAVRSLAPLAPPELYRLDRLQGIDAASYAMTAGASALAVIGAVVLPLWRAERADPWTAFRGLGGRAGARGQVRQVFVSAQIALTVWVLVVGTLVVRTVTSLQSLDMGFRPDGLTAFELGRTRTEDPESALIRQLGEALTEIRSAPGVVGATHLLSAPLAGSDSYRSIVFPEGRAPEESLGANPYMYLQVIDPGGLDVLGVPVLEGRGFEARDDAAGAPVVVVNATAARALSPEGEAVGKRVRVPVVEYADTWWTIAGVVADTRYDELRDAKPVVYFPAAQFSTWVPAHLVVRTDDSSPPTLQIVRDALARSAPSMSVKAAAPVADLLDGPLARPRFTAVILIVFGAVTLLLAGVGIYGVMSYFVRSRRREIGVRLACGASPRRAGATVLGTALWLTAAGAVLGAAAAWMSSALFESLLFGVVPSDPTSLVVALAVTSVCVLAASWVPARRAAQVDPSRMLRNE